MKSWKEAEQERSLKTSRNDHFDSSLKEPMEDKDYYKILEISREATEEEIKKSYRRIAMQYHPDRNPGNKEAEERFKIASEAYEVLRDPQKREVYDRYGIEGLKGSGFTGFRGFEDIFTTFGDIFEDFFGMGRTESPEQQGFDGSRSAI